MKLLGKFTCYFPKKTINILHNHSPQTISPNIFRESMGFVASKRSSMKGQKQPVFIPLFLIFSVLFLCFSASVASNDEEVEDEREFDYNEKGEKGPHHWGDLKKEWAACKTGAMQSPIDLTNDRVKIIAKSVNLEKNYKPAESIIKNRGHDISLQWPDHKAGSITIDGIEYVLLQVHWHSPSEHTINGKRYALEAHMVHKAADPNVKSGLAVSALLYEHGSPNDFLSQLISNITDMTDEVQERSMGVIDPNLIEIDGVEYYRYIGSLTVPPCTEGVIWIINKKIATVSKEQVHAIREAVHDYAEQNARPVQTHNEREMELHSPHS
ncbi:hypothetical protein ES319_D01G239600v1 [Gossypium barbadense]|uniref:Carbonic anhydrase n=1 Tax=Gossypium barbadense TaxID=3634 RepID=A0A5J5SSE8_GOSBA|nr:hypothetical protein ES319_D01G239600v1 [Gossypium barbadense]